MFPLSSLTKKTVTAGLRRGIFNGKFNNLSIQRTDTRVIPVHMQCLGHKHSIHGVIASWSFRWIKQFTHLSVAKIGIRFDWRPQGGDFQRQSLKLRYQTDRYKCASSAHALYGSQTRHPSCESVLIIPLDQAIDSPVRWEILEHVEFSTEKSEITLSTDR